MVEMKLVWQIGPMTNILNVTSITIFLPGFPVNLAFINYFDNLIDSLKSPILLNRSTYKQIYQFLWKHLILNQTYLKHQKH